MSVWKHIRNAVGQSGFCQRNRCGRHKWRTSYLSVEQLEERMLLSHSSYDPFLSIVTHGQNFADVNSPDPPQWAVDLGEAISAKFHASPQNIIVYGWPTSVPWNPISEDLVKMHASFLASTVVERILDLYHQNGDQAVDVHFIAHSRGAGLISETVKILDSFASLHPKIDHLQITTLDPHPTALDPLLPPPGARPRIIDFWDNYYQEASSISQHVVGLDDIDLNPWFSSR